MVITVVEAAVDNDELMILLIIPWLLSFSTCQSTCTCQLFSFFDLPEDLPSQLFKISTWLAGFSLVSFFDLYKPLQVPKSAKKQFAGILMGCRICYYGLGVLGTDGPITAGLQLDLSIIMNSTITSSPDIGFTTAASSLKRLWVFCRSTPRGVRDCKRPYGR
jgi:hypothetical protein